MASSVVLTAAVEGTVDEALLRRLCEYVGTNLGQVHGRRGKAYLLNNLRGFNNSARFRHWLVLVDLDDDGQCAPEVLAIWLPIPARLMRLRIAVHEVEAWLLADRERLASYLGISLNTLPEDPDRVPDPKQTLVNLARGSRRKAIREDIVPLEGSGQMVGPAYTTRMIEFIQNIERGWRPAVAAELSESLRKCISAVNELTREGFLEP
jgi:hypothetical protein